MSCFNITFPDDTEYEFVEAIKLTIDTSGSVLNPGTITEADVCITDDDGKTQYTHTCKHSTIIKFRYSDPKVQIKTLQVWNGLAPY